MKITSFLFIILFFVFFGITFARNLKESNEEFSSLDENIKYYRLSKEKIKKFLFDENIYIIDTRDLALSAKGFIPNTILIPLSLISFIYSVVPVGAEIIILTELDNKQEVIDSVIELYTYKLLGYSIFSEINENNYFELQTVEYNPNSNNNIQEIVDRGENMIDIREKNEILKTGYIKQAKLIPLSNFLTDYEEIPKNGNVFIFCRSGTRAVIAITFLKREGFTNRLVVMKGGMNRVIEEGYPLIQMDNK